MKVLVTGGGGFIGAWVVRRLLAEGHEPVIFNSLDARDGVARIAGEAAASGLTWITGDIGETDEVVRAAEGCEAIIHLAGVLTPACREDPLLGARVNLVGTLNAFLAARTQGIGHVAYMSSAGVFGPDGGDIPLPTTLYGAFKLGAEHAARAFHAEDGISSIGFRPYVVYGPGRETGASAGPTLACRAAARQEPYCIPFSGQVDMIHANDVARAFVIAVEAPPTGAHAVNLHGSGVEVAEVVEHIRTLVPGAEISMRGAAMPIRFPAADRSLAELLPDWAPVPLVAGLAGTIDYYRETAQ